MVRLSSGTFKCVLLTPSGKLLDCRSGSLILPSHDGAIGILRNHAPMLCKLGMGIMIVRDIPSRDDAYYLIDGGFARISENNVTVLTYEVTTFEGMDPDQAERIVAKAKERIVGGGYYIKQRGEEMGIEKAGQLVKLGKLSSIVIE